MRTLHIPVAVAACFSMLFCASASFAGDQKKDQPQQQSMPQTVQPVPQQQVQPQTAPPPVIVVTPPAQPQQQQQAQQPKTGTTQTTGAQYMVPEEKRAGAERVVSATPNTGLLGTGAGLFVLSYAPSAVIGATSNRDEDKRLFIPVAGPFLDLAERDCRARPCGENEDIAKAALITSGAVQGAGALMALGSLFIPEEKTVKTKPAEEAKPSVKILPVSFGAGAGIGAIGRF